MRKTSRRLLWMSAFFFVASMSTCIFGVQYAINQIPPETRSSMADTDWVGVEWIERGGILLVISTVLLLIPPILWVFRRIVGSDSDS